MPVSKGLKIKRLLLWLLLLIVMLVMARIGARHYFRLEEVKPGTFPVTVGRILALWTVTLLLLQPILGMRCRFLDRLSGLDRLLKFHRISGIACLGMAAMHPLFMYVSGLKKIGPLSINQWPEALGALCIIGLWLTVVSSAGRKFVELSYEQWSSLHRLTVPLIILALAHMFVIESAMSKGLLLWFWLFFLILWAGALITVGKITPAAKRIGEDHVVASAGNAAEGVWEINLRAAENCQPFSFVPGQFAFVSVTNAEITGEEHPFTIASAPSDKGEMQFLIKACGDWTRQLGALKPGDRVRVSGPYGIFSPYFHDNVSSLIMIAGGIGITPMLSILRKLSADRAKIPIKLIWSFRSAAEAPCLQEISGLSETLPGLEIIRIASRDSHQQQGQLARLDKKSLAGLVSDYCPGMLVMVCGPSIMMKNVRSWLVASGYPSAAVISEEFAL